MGKYEGAVLDAGSKISLLGLRLLIGSLVLLFYAPLVMTCFKAFQGPESIGLYWFHELFADPSFFSAVRNSFVLAFMTAVASVILSLMYILRNPTVPKKISTYYDKLMWVSMSMPEIILALSLLSLFVWLRFQLGFGSLILAHITLTMSFSYWILSLQYRNLDYSLVEAAMDLGADKRTILFQVILPQMKPAIISSFWICFLLSLDDFLVTFFISGSSYETLPLKLFSLLKTGLSPKINALGFLILMISTVVLVGLYPVLKKIRGSESKI